MASIISEIQSIKQGKRAAAKNPQHSIPISHTDFDVNRKMQPKSALFLLNCVCDWLAREF